MSDETRGREDAAQDAEACAEALESLDRIALDELSLSDLAVDAQDEAREGTEDEGSDADARHKATNLYQLDIPVEWYGKDGKADAATKLETDYLAQILMPSIKAQD